MCGTYGYGYGVDRRKRRAIAAVPPYTFTNAEAEAHVGRLSARPSNAICEAIDNYVGALKSNVSGGLGGFDYFIVPLGITAKADAILDWKNFAAPTESGDLGYSPGVGLTGTDTAFLRIGLSPGNLVASTQNNAAFGAFIEAEEAGSADAIVGKSAADPIRHVLRPRQASGFMSGRLNGSGDLTTTVTVPNRLGLSAISRVNTAVTFSRDGTLVQTLTQASSDPALQTSQIQVFLNAGAYATDTVSLIFGGSSKTVTELAAIRTAHLAFKAAVAAALG